MTMPLCLAALRYGQANAMLAALILHAGACLSRGQWWRASALMVLAFATKPLGIVLPLLAVTVYAPLRWRLSSRSRRPGIVPLPVHAGRLRNGPAPRIPRQYPALRNKPRTPLRGHRRYHMDFRRGAVQRCIEMDAHWSGRAHLMVVDGGGQAARRAVALHVAACAELRLPHAV